MKKALSRFQGIKLTDYDKKEKKLTVIGDVDYVTLGASMRKIARTDLLSVGPAPKKLSKRRHKSGEEDKPGYESDESIINSATGEGEGSSSAHPCRLFSLAEIQSATKKFDDGLVIGNNGSGKMYKGQISRKEAGRVVAIKRANPISDRDELAFRAEIDTLRKFHHRHLMSLIGYCDDKKEKILVYEYVPNGPLNLHLHEAHTPLSWVARLKIAVGVTRGLNYLHTGLGTQHGVIHRDVKSANIYLNENWEAVISGFGLSRNGPTDPYDSHVTTGVAGTLGYVDPSYLMTGRVTWKSDVYSLGVVLFELISGRCAVNWHYDEDDWSLVEWAKKSVEERKLDEMVDSSIKGTISAICLKRFIQNAYRCVHHDPDEQFLQ